MMWARQFYESAYIQDWRIRLNIEEILQGFAFKGRLISYKPYGSGHINDTYLLEFDTGGEEIQKIVLQRLNHIIFTKPREVMANILAITSYLRERIIEQGGDPERETLNVIPAASGESYMVDQEGNYWRTYHYVKDTISFDQVEDKQDFYESAYAFGNFQSLLSEYPADTLYETIVKFHDTKARFLRFKEAVAKDALGRAKEVQPEIAFVLARQDITEVFGDLLAKGEMPLRVTHNDTKLNNVLFDVNTRKGICVVDLDTVMPGFAAHDFGDAIRFGANTGTEDEKDLSKISCDLELFEIYTEGYLKGCDGKLSDKEIEMLPMGAKVMSFECGMRFLTDYLEGDHYFKIHWEGQNLDRCRTQFKLVADMEQKWDRLNEIVAAKR